MEIDRVAINAALETLIAGQDHDGTAAQLVLDYALTVPLTTKYSFSFTRIVKKRGGSVLGYIPGFGNLKADEDKKPERKTSHIGTKRERIGQYRLWRTRPGHILFRHYWGIDTPSIKEYEDPEEETPTYHLAYDTESKHPIYFASEENQVTTRWSWPVNMIFYSTYLVAIHGEVPRKEQKIGGGFWIG